MKKPKIVMTVLKEDSGYSATATVKGIHINTESETLEELMGNVLEAVNLSFVDRGFTYTADEIGMK